MAPWSSLAYGLFLTLISYAVLWVLHASNLLYLAFPATSGFLIVGPFLAIGLYEKSRMHGKGRQIAFSDMLVFWPASGGQLAYAGLLLGLLVYQTRVWGGEVLRTILFSTYMVPSIAVAHTPSVHRKSLG